VAPRDSARPVPGGAGLSAAERRLLVTMPLHAITAVHGEGGLRERLLIEAGRLPAAGRGRVGGALELMPRLHARDRHEQYREHVAASLEGSPWARVVKVSDFTDNAVGLFHTTGESLPRRAGKYLPPPTPWSCWARPPTRPGHGN